MSQTEHHYLNRRPTKLGGLQEAFEAPRVTTIWFDPEMDWEAKPSGKRADPTFSDAAIQTVLTMKVLFGMALRPDGLVCGKPSSVDGLIGSVPELSAPSADAKRTLAVTFHIERREGPAAPALSDSTGSGEVEGESNGAQARRPETTRVWRKIHIGIDEQTLEIRGSRDHG